ncbi:FAD-dependent oxidoreductase [Maribacter hydrothermalis]|uniref:FAD-dependent oxidoreductase n=1 Tax=Maribacter hydrothermalis TaxID=1836467 RepID=A0A1B7Z211_9FLAO|nr:FAD-dependent oxidoreductase [Maribacter hydrothermalis]APQ19356.1 FAD-dependent oxidoreductase [Maribacter hydrothermalis]OBR36753.1 FAD-dependent oxidoreductase [Maribacter hydrothermalis]
MNFNASISKKFNTDILVIGSGSAGSTAALAASRGNVKVSLVERYGFPGGTSTQMLDTFYGFFTPSDTPRKIVGGIPDTIVNSLNSTGDIFLRPNTYGAGTGVNYNPERLKHVWDMLLTQNGISLYYHSTLVGVESVGEYSTCVFFHKGIGFFTITAKRVIDATGDADYCHWANIPYEKAGDNEPAQSMTTTFRISNVDHASYEKAGGKEMLKQRMAEAFEKGTHPLPRKEGSAHEMCQPKCISTVAVKVVDLDPLNVEEITKAEIEGRRQSFIFEDFFRSEIPGYENAKIIGLSNQIGVRETRRVYGNYRLTKEDCMGAKQFDDQIFLCGAPIEDHRKGDDGSSETFWQYVPNGGAYGVPYGTIVPQNSMNTWVVGRCFSATHDAHASCRSMAQTMSMGQAAGLAAFISLQKDHDAKNIPIKKLQDQIIEIGGILQVPEKIADISRNGWSNN